MVPAGDRRRDCQERAGTPQEESWEARPGPAARQPGGIWGGGVPSDDGTGGNGKAGACQSPDRAAP